MPFVPKKQFLMKPHAKPVPKEVVPPDRVIYNTVNRPSPQYTDVGDLELKKGKPAQILNFIAPTDVTVRDACIHVESMRGLGTLNARILTADEEPVILPLERGVNEMPSDIKIGRHKRIRIYLCPESDEMQLQGVAITFIME